MAAYAVLGNEGSNGLLESLLQSWVGGPDGGSSREGKQGKAGTELHREVIISLLLYKISTRAVI